MMKSKIVLQLKEAIQCMSSGTAYMQLHIVIIYRFCGKEASLFVRRLPCLCASCMLEEFDDCEQQQKVGVFEEREMRKKGTRVPKMRYEEYTREVRDGRRTFVVQDITESRYIEGVYQYKVLWQGFVDTTWVDADRLSCIDIIEKFEGSMPPE